MAFLDWVKAPGTSFLEEAPSGASSRSSPSFTHDEDMNDFDKTFKAFAAIAVVWGFLVVAFWASVIGVGVYALFHYGVL